MNRRRSRDGLSFGVAYTYEIVNKTLGADRSLRRRQPRQELQLRRPPAAHARRSTTRGWCPDSAESSSRRRCEAIVNDWQISGVTSFLSGTQGGFTYAYSAVPDGRAHRQRLDRRRSESSAHHLRSDAAAVAADVRAPVQDRMHRGAGRRRITSAPRAATSSRDRGT